MEPSPQAADLAPPAGSKAVSNSVGGAAPHRADPPAAIHVQAFGTGSENTAKEASTVAAGTDNSTSHVGAEPASAETAAMRHGCFACLLPHHHHHAPGSSGSPPARSPTRHAAKAMRQAAVAEALTVPMSPVVQGLLRHGSYAPANPPPERLASLTSGGPGGTVAARQLSMAQSLRSGSGSGSGGAFPASPKAAAGAPPVEPLTSCPGTPPARSTLGALSPLAVCGDGPPPVPVPAMAPSLPPPVNGACPTGIFSRAPSAATALPAPPSVVVSPLSATGSDAAAAWEAAEHAEHEWVLEPPSEEALIGLLDRCVAAGRCGLPQSGDDKQQSGSLIAGPEPPPTCCIRCLDLSRARLGPKGAATLARAAAAFPRLQSLLLSHCDVGPDGIKAICSAGAAAWPGLEELDMALGCQYGGCGAQGAQAIASAAASWPGMTVVNLRGNKIGNEGAAALAATALPAWPRLEQLNLSYCDLSIAAADALASAAPACRALKVLDLGFNPELGPAGAKALAASGAAGWGQLQLLALSGCSAGDAGAAAVATAGTGGAWLALRALLVDDCGVGPDGARALGSAAAAGAWPGLQLLDLGHNPLGDEGVSQLLKAAAAGHHSRGRAARGNASPQRASTAAAAAAGASHPAAPPAGAWPTLRVLRLPAALLFPAGAAAIADTVPGLWPSLEDLDISDNPMLGEPGLLALALGGEAAAAAAAADAAAPMASSSSPPARSQHRGSGDGVAAARWCALRTLQLARCGLDGTAAAAIVVPGAAWPALEVLVLSDNSVDDGAVSALAARAAAALPALRQLVIARDPDRMGAVISYAGATALAAAAPPAFERLEELDLTGQCIGVAGAEALASAAPRWRALRTLCLDHNQIGDDGARAIAAARAWPELRCLRLRGCSVGDAGAEALVGAGTAWPWLQELDLSHNGVGAAGVRAIATLGACWADLRVLKLGHNTHPAGGGPPAEGAALLLLAEAGGANWPDLEVLTLSGRWAGSGAGGGGASGSDGTAGKAAAAASDDRASMARVASGSSSSESFKRADAGVAAAAMLALDAPKQLARLSAGAGGGGSNVTAARGEQHTAAAATAPQPRSSSGGAAAAPPPLSPAAAAALGTGPAGAARAFLECAGDAWPELRALELPALGRPTLFDAEHERLEEMARRAAPRLKELNFRRHYHHM